MDSNADRRLECANRAIVSYLLDNSAEFPELSDLREKASNTQPKYIDSADLVPYRGGKIPQAMNFFEISARMQIKALHRRLYTSMD